MNERESILAALEILADRELTGRLLTLSKTIDQDVAAGRLLTAVDALANEQRAKTTIVHCATVRRDAISFF